MNHNMLWYGRVSSLPGKDALPERVLSGQPVRRSDPPPPSAPSCDTIGLPMKSHLMPASIHPDLRLTARLMPPLTCNPRPVPRFRLLDPLMQLRPGPPDIHIQNITISGPDGALRLRVYRRKHRTTPAPTLLWLHGGGYIIGKPEQDDGRCCQYVRALDIAVISVDYRLAPEHPFPAGLLDSYAALQWIETQGLENSILPECIAVGGASAGAGLAAALAQYTCDRGEIPLAFQLLVYPMLDDRTCLRPDLSGREYLLWTPESNRFAWEAYLGMPCGAEDIPAYAAPARRTDLFGLPPAWIGVGSLDLFCAENSAYAQTLQHCHVPCQLEIIPGAFHGFDVLGLPLPVVRLFRLSQVAALQRAFHLR
jgi:acetyl esterase/lipase